MSLYPTKRIIRQTYSALVLACMPVRISFRTSAYHSDSFPRRVERREDVKQPSIKNGPERRLSRYQKHTQDDTIRRACSANSSSLTKKMPHHPLLAFRKPNIPK